MGRTISLGQVLPVKNASVAAGFLTIVPDAASGALGNTGIAGDGDVYSIFHNPAKYAFGESDGGIGVYYNPWFGSYAGGLSLSGAVGFYRWQQNSFSAGFRYFSYGEMELTDDEAVVLSQVRPYELAAEVAYALQLSPSWAGSATFRYIHSYLGRLSREGNDDRKGADAYAVDVSFVYRSRFSQGRNKGLRWGAGIRLENMGTKLIYRRGDDGYYLPSLLKVGASLTWSNRIHQFVFLCDLGKWMVTDKAQDNRNRNAFNAMAVSFREFAVKMLIPGVGMEYDFREFLHLRCGYSYQHPDVGNQRFLSFGCGGTWHGAGVDFAYVCYTGKRNALDNMVKVACYYTFSK